tara:strand:+ start:90 stop:359 length:270 start_codon:yes stop_codon:yes gene_type:complete
MSTVRRATGWIVTIALAILSLHSIITSGEIGYQSWIFLLLMPFSVALVISSGDRESRPANISHEWKEDEKTDEEKTLKPGDFGFDTPVL